jgi:agmatinase
MDFRSEPDEHTDFIIIGVPYDGNMTQYRGRCHIAPDEVRILSLDLSLTSEDGTDLNSLHITDLGNIYDDFTEKIPLFLKKVPNAVPIFIGGSHSITIETLDSLNHEWKSRELHYISLDAHLDCYDEWKGNKYAHCTVTQRVFEMLGSNPEKISVIGVRDIDLPEMEWAKKHNLKYLRMNEIDQLTSHFLPPPTKKKPLLYFSIDIDVFDPSVAPGTGYPIPGGITYRNYLRILDEILKRYTIVALDIVEFSPDLDLRNKMTAFLVAKLLIETIVKIKKEKLSL